MANVKVTALAEATSVSKDDLFMIIDDPAGSEANKKITFANMLPDIADGVKADADIDDALTTLDASFDVNNKLVFNALSQTIIDYINSSGGGAITNFADDNTLESNGSSQIQMKDGGTQYNHFSAALQTKLETDRNNLLRQKLINNYFADNQILIPRHKKMNVLLQKSKTGVYPFKGLCLGNSIMEGTGASDVYHQFFYLMATKLYNYSGHSTYNDWSPVECAVGGSITDCVLSYLGDSDQNTAYYSQAPQEILPAKSYLFSNYDPQYAAIITLRNDAGTTDLDDFEKSFRLMIETLAKKELDIFFITDPLLITYATGEILDTQANFWDYVDIALKICSEYSVSVVNVAKYLQLMSDNGEDITVYYLADGKHPNDAGHQLIVDLTFECMTKTSTPLPIQYKNGANFTYNNLYSQFLAYATNGTLTDIGNPTNGYTARRRNTGESVHNAYVLTAGQYVTFKPAFPVRHIIVHLIDNADASGTITVNQPTTYPVGAAINATSGGTKREISKVLWINPAFYTFHDPLGNIKIVASGKAYIAGITIIGEEQQQANVTLANFTEDVGSWTAEGFYTNADGTIETGLRADNVGDKLTIKWFGTSLQMSVNYGTGFGKFTCETDGGGTTERDCYFSSLNYIKELLLEDGLDLAWHITEIIITTKNASSAANKIRVGRMRVYSSAQFPIRRIAFGQAGDELPTLAPYKKLTERVISDSPDLTISNDLITVTGTGTIKLYIDKE